MQDQSISSVFCDPAKELLNGFSTHAFAFSKQYCNNILCKSSFNLALRGTFESSRRWCAVYNKILHVTGQSGLNAILEFWGGKASTVGGLTSLLLYLSKAPHGGLFCMVRLAWISRCRSDPLVSNVVEVWGLKGFSSVVAPELLPHTSMKLLSKCLQGKNSLSG